MDSPDPPLRRSARVLVVDADDRLLLMHGIDPARPDPPVWFTVGGGIDDGETPEQAAARELLEETGLDVEPGQLGQPVWRREAVFGFAGVTYRQDETYYLVRVTAFEPSRDRLDPFERDTVYGYGWWSAADLESTAERFVPPELLPLLRDLT